MDTLMSALEVNERMASNGAQNNSHSMEEDEENHVDDTLSNNKKPNENSEDNSTAAAAATITTTTTTPAAETTSTTTFANEPKQTEEIKSADNTPAVQISEEDSKWHTVGIFSGLSANVNNYIDNSAWTSAGKDINAENLPDLSSFQRINLEPGTAYRFRIRAINSCGASEWSEISSFKTCLPGFPGAPSAIKISKSSEGAHLTWEPPPSCVSSNEIIEYSVYLAVKPGRDKDGKVAPGGAQRTPAQLAFVRVYVGPSNQCTVSHNALTAAHVDCSNKPAIIFRIAARNEKGYGPATQVRWLQDAVSNPNANTTGNSSQSPQRGVKAESLATGASPIKRFRTNSGRNIPGQDN